MYLLQIFLFYSVLQCVSIFQTCWFLAPCLPSQFLVKYSEPVQEREKKTNITGVLQQVLQGIIINIILRWLPIVFCPRARVLISKISRWCKLSNSTLKSRAGSHSKMLTNMVPKLLKIFYRKCCVDWLRFQNIVG